MTHAPYRWALSLSVLLLIVAGPFRSAHAQRTVLDPGDEETPRFELFLGLGGGGGNWHILNRDDMLPLDVDGLHASGYLQTAGFYGHFDARWDTLQVRGTGEDLPSFLRVHLSGRVLGSLVRGQAGGIAAGLYGRYDRSRVYATDRPSPGRGLKVRETQTYGGLLALHSNLESSARIIVMGGGLVERQTTGLDLPVPQVLGGGLLGVHAEFPLGSRLRVHLRGEGGAWLWSSPYTEAGLTGELVEGFFWDGAARLSVKLFSGVAAYGGVAIRGQSEVIRFREGPREVEVDEEFMSALSGTFGIVFRNL